MTFLYYASNSFADRAKVLVDSINKYHPGSKIVHINPETKLSPGNYIPGMAKDRLIKTLELLEAGEPFVVVVGADCEFFNSVKEDVMHTLKTYDIILVPHVHKPTEKRSMMAQFYRTGHANADYMVFKNTDNVKECLRWMISVTEGEDKNNVIFYEQTWLSATPFLFEKVYIERSPAYNVAYFNILDRDFKYIDDVPFVGHLPVKMVQYSGYVKEKPEKMSKYSGTNVTGDILTLFKRYDERIEK